MPLNYSYSNFCQCSKSKSICRCDNNPSVCSNVCQLPCLSTQSVNCHPLCFHRSRRRCRSPSRSVITVCSDQSTYRNRDSRYYLKVYRSASLCSFSDGSRSSISASKRKSRSKRRSCLRRCISDYDERERRVRFKSPDCQSSVTECYSACDGYSDCGGPLITCVRKPERVREHCITASSSSDSLSSFCRLRRRSSTRHSDNSTDEERERRQSWHSRSPSRSEELVIPNSRFSNMLSNVSHRKYDPPETNRTSSLENKRMNFAGPSSKYLPAPSRNTSVEQNNKVSVPQSVKSMGGIPPKGSEPPQAPLSGYLLPPDQKSNARWVDQRFSVRKDLLPHESREPEPSKSSRITEENRGPNRTSNIMHQNGFYQPVSEKSVKFKVKTPGLQGFHEPSDLNTPAGINQRVLRQQRNNLDAVPDHDVVISNWERDPNISDKIIESLEKVTHALENNQSPGNSVTALKSTIAQAKALKASTFKPSNQQTLPFHPILKTRMASSQTDKSQIKCPSNINQTRSGRIDKTSHEAITSRPPIKRIVVLKSGSRQADSLSLIQTGNASTDSSVGLSYHTPQSSDNQMQLATGIESASALKDSCLSRKKKIIVIRRKNILAQCSPVEIICPPIPCCPLDTNPVQCCPVENACPPTQCFPSQFVTPGLNYETRNPCTSTNTCTAPIFISGCSPQTNCYQSWC